MTAVKPQCGFHPIDEVKPRRQSRNDLSHCSQDRHAINTVERVLEIEFDEDPVRVCCVAFGPLPGGVHCGLCASWGTDADLKRFQAGPHVFLHAGQQTFPNDSFADRDWSIVSPIWMIRKQLFSCSVIAQVIASSRIRRASCRRVPTSRPCRTSTWM